MAAESSIATAKRNRMIAIAAGAVTVVAIVLAFASGYLGEQWSWLRPAGELLLLAELVGLIVLERHQLFEPVSEKVSTMEARMAEMQTALGQIREQMGTAGQISVVPSGAEIMQVRTRLLTEALARDHEGPQIVRVCTLAGVTLAQDTRGVGEEVLGAWRKTLAELLHSPNSPSNAKSHRFSLRLMVAWSTLEALGAGVEFARRNFADSGVLNAEVKVFVRTRPEALLSPVLITDRDAVLACDDPTHRLSWGFALHGRQYAARLERWFDDRWAAISDSYLIYSRNGINQNALDRIHKEIEANEAARSSSAN